MEDTRRFGEFIQKFKEDPLWYVVIFIIYGSVIVGMVAVILLISGYIYF